MLGDLFVALVILGGVSFLIFCLVMGIRTSEDKFGLTYYTRFNLECPVCHENNVFSKAKAYTRATRMNLTELKKEIIKCKSCEADISGLYLSSPFFRQALTEAEHLKGSREMALSLIEELHKIQGIPDGEVQTSYSNGKQRV